MFGDQYKGFMDFRSNRPDGDPNFAPLYVVVGAVLLAVSLVGWLGWRWWTLVAYVATVALAIAAWWYLRGRSRRRRHARMTAGRAP